MKITLKLFASFRQEFDTGIVQYDLPEGSTAQYLIDDIFNRHPTLSRFKGHVVVTVSLLAVPLTTTLHEGDEVAILPPVSGG